MNLSFLGDGLVRELAENFGDPFCDRGLLSMNELENQAAADPHSTAIQRTLGVRLLHDGKLEWARKVFESGLELDPNDASCQVGLACALEGMGKTQSAMEHVQACLNMNPAYGPALMARSRCMEKLSAQPHTRQLTELTPTAGSALGQIQARAKPFSALGSTIAKDPADSGAPSRVLTARQR